MKKLLPLLCIVHCQLSIVNCFSQTNVSGFINSNTTWTVAGSPYIVVGNALLSQGYTLTIDPGVVVKFNDSTALQIDGELHAVGTVANRITFTSNQASPAPGDWAKIHFSSNAVSALYNLNGDYVSGSIMKYCDVLYGGGLGYGEIHIEGSEPYISQCNIRYSSYSGIYSTGSFFVIDSSLSENNFGYGLYYTQNSAITCGLVIRGDTLRNNSGGGLFLGPHASNCGTHVINCFFMSDSVGGAIQLDGVITDIYIQHNTFSNNQVGNGGILGFGYSSDVYRARIEDNVFNDNTGGQGIIFLSANSSDVAIRRNVFLNNTANNGVIQGRAGLDGDTISCNQFLNNQTLHAVLNLSLAAFTNGVVVNHNIFDGNICNWNFQTSILTVMQGSGKIDFSNNIIKNNSVNNGRLCEIYANVNNTNQELQIHHNDFSNNTALKDILISGEQISNTALNFCYLKNNNFLDASVPYAIYDSIPYGSPNLHIDSNYWGGVSTAHIDSVIYDYFDFANQSIVYYMPILQLPILVDTTCPPSITTAINEVEKQTEGFTIYPNPAHNSITISLNKWMVDAGQLTMYDIAGRCVGFESLSHQSEVIVNENFSPGVYFVKVSDGQRSETKKLIIE